MFWNLEIVLSFVLSACFLEDIQEQAAYRYELSVVYALQLLSYEYWTFPFTKIN